MGRSLATTPRHNMEGNHNQLDCSKDHNTAENIDRSEINFDIRNPCFYPKTRLSPLKSTLTIPRLELSAITPGAKLLKHIRSNLDIPIEQTFIWSDSNVALTLIKSKNTLSLFIQNRIKIIKESASDAVLRYVPGDSNTADVGSRGIAIQNLIPYHSWWKGPGFFLQTQIIGQQISHRRTIKSTAMQRRTKDYRKFLNFFYSLNGSADGNDYCVSSSISSCLW